MHRDGAREGAGRGPGDGVRVKGTGTERDNGARACTGRCRGPGQRAITVHGDDARVHGKVQGTGAERDHGARGRCTGARKGAGVYGWKGTGAERCTGTVHGCTGRCRKGTGAERDNGARGRCTVQGTVHGCTRRGREGTWQSAITVHGDGVYG